MTGTLEQCDKESFEEDYAALHRMFRELTDALLVYKTEDDFWYQVPDRADRPENYKETSGAPPFGLYGNETSVNCVDKRALL